MRKLVRKVYIDPKITEYITHLVHATRSPKKYKLDNLENFIECGASPRASINLALAAKAHAFLRGRHFVSPEDIKEIGQNVLQHRIMTTYEAEAENVKSSDIVQHLFEHIAVP